MSKVERRSSAGFRLRIKGSHLKCDPSPGWSIAARYRTAWLTTDTSNRVVAGRFGRWPAESVQILPEGARKKWCGVCHRN